MHVLRCSMCKWKCNHAIENVTCKNFCTQYILQRDIHYFAEALIKWHSSFWIVHGTFAGINPHLTHKIYIMPIYVTEMQSYSILVHIGTLFLALMFIISMSLDMLSFQLTPTVIDNSPLQKIAMNMEHKHLKNMTLHSQPPSEAL